MIKRSLTAGRRPGSCRGSITCIRETTASMGTGSKSAQDTPPSTLLDHNRTCVEVGRSSGFFRWGPTPLRQNSATLPSGCSHTVGSHGAQLRRRNVVPDETRQVQPLSSEYNTPTRFSAAHTFSPGGTSSAGGPIMTTGAKIRPVLSRVGFCVGKIR